MTTRQRAMVSPPAGIEIIREMIRDIDADDRLRKSTFGTSVRVSLVSMKARLADGQFFSARMEEALNNWNIAIHRDYQGEAQKDSGRLM